MKNRSVVEGTVSEHSIRRLESRFGISVIIVSFAIAVGNLVGRQNLFEETFVQALSNVAVWLTIALGVALSAMIALRNRVGRLLQCIIVLGMACASALESGSGNLTSLVFFGLAALLATQYGLLQPRWVLKFMVLSILYGVFLAVGTYTKHPGASLGAALNLVGAGFIAYLFVVIASVRLREMEGRQAELARLVTERTRDLQDEADRRRLAEADARQTAERNETLAGDRAVLLRELHHRSKNDLQMILSLMSLRAGKGDHPELVDLLRPTQDRIRAIALVHEQLDGSERFDAIGLRDYLEHLLTHIQVSHREYEVLVRAEIDAEVAIKLESATHIGLVVHELVLCSYRYSFSPGSKGMLSLSARTNNGSLEIQITDDGDGIPDTVDPHAPDADEIAIVAGLIARMDASLSRNGSPAASWNLRIPLSSIQQTAKPVSISG